MGLMPPRVSKMFVSHHRWHCLSVLPEQSRSSRLLGIRPYWGGGQGTHLFVFYYLFCSTTPPNLKSQRQNQLGKDAAETAQ